MIILVEIIVHDHILKDVIAINLNIFLIKIQFPITNRALFHTRKYLKTYPLIMFTTQIMVNALPIIKLISHWIYHSYDLLPVIFVMMLFLVVDLLKILLIFLKALLLEY